MKTKKAKEAKEQAKKDEDKLQKAMKTKKAKEAKDQAKKTARATAMECSESKGALRVAPAPSRASQRRMR